MGHMVGKDIYKKLYTKVDSLTVRVPETEVLYDILRELYSEKEAEVVVKMPYSLASLGRISRLIGQKEEELAPILKGLALKGLVIDLVNNDKSYFMPSPMVIGIFEFTMMRTGKDVDLKKMAHLFREFMSGDDSFYRINSEKGAQVSFLRTLPYEESFRPDEFVEVLDYEKATYIVENTKKFALGLCSCRHEQLHTGHKKCDTPLETCSTFGMGVDYMVRNNLAREADKSEMLDNLARSKELGLVLSADNVKKGIQYMCHCCGCCCHYLAGLNKWGYTNLVLTSSYLAKWDDEKCIGCGKCARACPMNALEMEKEETPQTIYAKKAGQNIQRKRRVAFNESYCIGCGVCVSRCDHDSMHLVPRKQRVFTPEDSFEKTLLQALEKDNLQNLIFDNPQSITQTFMRGLLGGFLRLPLMKRMLMSKRLRSVFLGTMRWGVRSQGKGWMTEI